MLFWYSKSYFDIRSESENAILIFKILFWHSNWVGKSYFDIQNPISIFELSRKMLFWYSKSYFDIRTVGKSYFDIRNTILILDLSRIKLFWHSKSYFDIRTESENRILTFKVLFRQSNGVGKCYFDFQRPILTFELSRKIVFWHSKSYFDIRTEPENAILIFKNLFWIRTESENRNLTFEILFWHSNWVGKCYFDIGNPILTFELRRKMVFWNSKYYFDYLTFEIAF